MYQAEMHMLIDTNRLLNSLTTLNLNEYRQAHQTRSILMSRKLSTTYQLRSADPLSARKECSLPSEPIITNSAGCPNGIVT